LLTAWQESGLPVQVFCARRRVARASFYHWRRKISAEARPLVQRSFVPVEVAAPAPRLASVPERGVPAGIQIDLSSAVAIQVQVGFDSDSLRRALVILDELCC
jgi:hypothetical protein